MGRGLVFRGRFSVPSIDESKYSQALQDAIDVQIRQAAREWLRAVLPKIPVWTGTSRGTLIPLGRVLNVAIPISPASTAKAAIARGFGPSYGSARSYFSFEHRAQRTIFKWDTTLQYLIDNNNQNLNPPFHLKTPGPYGAFEAGKDAFDAYVQNVLPKRLPRVKDYMRYKSTVFGG